MIIIGDDLGGNQDMQDSVRDNASYRGKLYLDVFADSRMDMRPPGVASMAILWNRNHNWIAEQLLINSKDDPWFAIVLADDDHIHGILSLVNRSRCT